MFFPTRAMNRITYFAMPFFDCQFTQLSLKAFQSNNKATNLERQTCLYPRRSINEVPMKRILFPLLAAIAGFLALHLNAATYKEANGVVVVEAEHFDARTTNSDGHHYEIIPDEIGMPETPADTGFANARGGKYIQSLPDSLGGGQ